MSKAKKAHRAKVAKRNQRIQNEQRQFVNLVQKVKEDREAKEAFAEVSNPTRPNGMSHFLPLTGAETHDPFNDRDVWIAGPSAIRGYRAKEG
jgi:hypothetical protein